ncbi:inositol monophosphatase family protein [Leptospira inadai serovar Lyme str. 10]|uniref:Inositol monophosphatase family protein n=2 Tax=Leptospira inadai serovar Lyme TaxID=293084 RepID=V6H9L8_9LEPT|nr:inositol monophosphatase family protein [Leptospira inadai]EQA34853.1 inositol monophosphatase family protein [Leptospira inadai serovar Lyme str. 10]PNV75878.1 inositol monophosphatase [Leptospira inadai serovar Lyme]
MPIRSDLLPLFESISREAGEKILNYFDGKSEYSLKDPMQVLTDADIASHEVLFESLHREFSGIPIVLEEQENSEPLPTSYIVCDELDGTALFSRGMSEFSVIMAYVEDGKPVAGCIYFPAMASIVLSERGKGTTVDDHKIVFREKSDLSHSVVSLEINNTLTNEDFSWIANVVKNSLASRSLAATGAGFRELLLGKTDLFLNFNGAKVWDFAAGAVAIEEAGGILLNKEGKPLEWDKIRMSGVICKDSSLASSVFRLKPGGS